MFGLLLVKTFLFSVMAFSTPLVFCESLLLQGGKVLTPLSNNSLLGTHLPPHAC